LAALQQVIYAACVALLVTELLMFRVKAMHFGCFLGVLQGSIDFHCRAATATVGYLCPSCSRMLAAINAH
jgi:hypothetical protein